MKLLIFHLLVFFAILTTVNGDINNCPPQLHRTKYLVAYKNSSCLEIHTSSYKWINARKDCQSRHGDLVQITTADKQSFIMSQLKRLYTGKLWIGATDSDQEGKWLWISGQVMNGHYGNWKSGQGPTQSGFLFSNGMLEDCALLDYSDAGRWHDYMCNNFFYQFGYICEYNQLGQSAVLPSQTTKAQMPNTKTTSRLTKQSVRVQHTTNRKTVQTTKIPVLKTSTTRRESSSRTVYLSTTKTAAVQTSSLKPGTGTNTTTPSQSSNKSRTPKPTNKPPFGHSVSTKTTQKSKQSSVQQQNGKKSTSTKATVKPQNGVVAHQAQNKKNDSTKVSKGMIIGVTLGSVVCVACIAATIIILIRRRRRRSRDSIGIENPIYGKTPSPEDVPDRF